MNDKPQPQEQDLDTPTSFLGLTLREIKDWEEKSKNTCKKYHEQPCWCDPWD